MHHYLHRISTPLIGGLLGASCFSGPDNPTPRASSPPPRISFHPYVGSNAAAPATRINLTPAPTAEEIALARGKLSSRELRDLQTGSESSALQKRLIPFLAWSDGRSLQIAPQVWMEPGEVVTIGSTSSLWSYSFRVEDPDELPRLLRVWPPIDEGSSGTFAVWCLGTPIRGEARSAALTLALEPGSVRGRLVTGSLEGIGRDCVSWEALEPPTHAIAPPPTALLDDGRMARVEPTSIVPSWVDDQGSSESCGHERTPLGPACAIVMDDRLLLSVEHGAWWLAVRMGGTLRAAALTRTSPMLVSELLPESELVWEAYGVDLRGGKRAWHGRVRTEPRMAHVVLNEVMANPTGAEPQQEWVELYNDGAAGVELEGWTIEDPGGVTRLPVGRLEPGRFALVVNEGWQADSWPDPTPTEGTLILRVPKLGNQGLSNGGEPLQLREATGRLSSGFLPKASPKAGQSIARTSPDAVDWLEGSFVSCTTSTPGAPNKL